MGADEFAVVADSLLRAAIDIRIVAESVRRGTIEGLDDRVDVGHERLAIVLGDFCARWNQGAKDLIHGDEHLADRVREAGQEYVLFDEETAALFASVLSGLDRWAS